MAKIHIKRLVDKYSFDPNEIKGDSYRKLVSDIMYQNTLNVQKKLLRQNNDFFRVKAPKNLKTVALPDLTDITAKRALYIRKAAIKGKLLTQTLRDKLATNLREVLSQPKYLYQKGKLKGTLKDQAINEFRQKISNTFNSYKRSEFPNNLETIVRTEIRSAVNMSNFEYMNTVKTKNKDLEIYKIWIHNSRISKKPRKHHAKMNGKSIPIYREFVLLNPETMVTTYTPHPHHESMPPEEQINCSCELQYQFVKRKIEKSVYKAWQLKSGKWHDYDNVGNIVEVSAPGQKKETDNIKYNDENKIIARPIKDIGIEHGQELPENIFLHGSKKEIGDIDNFSISNSPLGTLYVTRNWDTADNYADHEESRIKAIKLKDDAEVIDLTDKKDCVKLAIELKDNLENYKDIEIDQLANSLYNMNFHVSGLSDDPELGEFFYNKGIDAVKDNYGNLDVMSDNALETYNPKKKPNEQS